MDTIIATETFKTLAEKWRAETGMLSSITKKLNHPTYQAIIAMGEPVIPLILRELQERPDHWFEALKAITGQTPVPASHRTDMRLAAKAWVDWGKEKGYLD